MNIHKNARLTPHGRPSVRRMLDGGLRPEEAAQQCGVGRSTIGRWLKRAGLNRLALLEPAPPVVRYEHPEPGDMLHLDTKKLGRFQRPGHRVTGDRTQNSSGAGWEFVHVALDDNSRFACAEVGWK